MPARRFVLFTGALILILANVALSQEPFEVWEATIPELQSAMEDGRVTSVQLVDAYLARIEAYDQKGPALNSILRINPNAGSVAEDLDRERAERGPRGPLHGVPIILKDNYDTADMPTTGGSIALAGLVPPDDGFQVRKLREGGAVILAKSNMHELARGITSISSLGGQTRNPYDPSRNPGGSSGGTGAAVAASFAAVGMGSDTCGSIRIPSSHHNLVGLRPTKGLSSIDGIIPLSHTQDTGGPLARSVVDLAIVLDATVGPDPADEATRILDGRTIERFSDALSTNALLGARVGVLTNLFGDAAEDQAVTRVVRAAVDEMEALGATAVEITIPDFDELLRASGVIVMEFGSDLLAYLAATPGAAVASAADIAETGLFHSALENSLRRNSPVEIDNDDYQARLEKRVTIRETVVGLLDDHLLDALVYPTIRRKAARIGDPQRGSSCQLSAHSGLPALTVPAGFTNDGLPVGVELLGRLFSDTRLVAMAYAYEQGTHHHRRPPSRTPHLENGSAPEPITFGASSGEAEAEFTFDPTRNVLGYSIQVSGVSKEDIYAVLLHVEGEDGNSRVVGRFSGPGMDAVAGAMILNPLQLAALLDDRLYLKTYTRLQPMGAAGAPLMVPSEP